MVKDYFRRVEDALFAGTISLLIRFLNPMVAGEDLLLFFVNRFRDFFYCMNRFLALPAGPLGEHASPSNFV